MSEERPAFGERLEDLPEDELTFRIQRAVESNVKCREIEKSLAAMDGEQRGDDHGRPPFGLCYNGDGRR